MPGVCPRCLREVYFAEEKLALGKVWHTFCFSCSNCRKLLDSWTVATHSGELFCRNCCNRLFSTSSVRPSLPLPISPILPRVDKRDPAATHCRSVPNCCCGGDCSFIGHRNQEPVLAAPLICPLDKQRLLVVGEEEEIEADRAPKLGEDKRFENGTSLLDLRNSETTICDQPSSPTAITAWYNKHHSVSQSTFSCPSSAQRPSSTPTSGEAVSSRNACNIKCSGNRRPGSPCRLITNHRTPATQCHCYHCHEFQKSDRIQVSQEHNKIKKEDRDRNSIQDYRNNFSHKLTVFYTHSKKSGRILPLIESSRNKYASHYTSPPFRRRISFQSDEGDSLGSQTIPFPTMQSNVDEGCSNVAIISLKHSSYQDHDIASKQTNSPDGKIVIDDDVDDISDTEADARMRGGCGGGRGSGCCCSSSGGSTRIGLDQSGPCSMTYQKERSSTIEGACGCSGRTKRGCDSSADGGSCCSSGFGVTSAHSPRVAGCCGTSCDENNEGACASKSATGRRLTGYETCPPRSPDSCSVDPSGHSPCSAVACSPPCSGRKGCCPPAGCRPVRRRVERCNTPCTGDTQSCGGGGCCGSGCRGGCGKPGQTCLPLRPCTIPPCKPHPQGGGSPCMPPRRCAPQPPCCRIPVIPGTPGSMSGIGGGGGSRCCRSGSPGGRFAGGGGCSPSTSCQPQTDSCIFDSRCQAKFPTGCECLGGGQDCQRCGRKVYQAEMQIASGVPYHNICFSCFCCRKPLETLTYHENCGEIYCKQCYVRNFGPQGYGYAGVLQTPM